MPSTPVLVNQKADTFYMQRALTLARKGRGATSPNPMVGAVVVKAGKIIAEGYHQKAGADHAEIVALKKISKAQAKGSTLYVTLEPCCHQGRTPPCVDAILRAGIRRVVIGLRDPNPKVSGKGIRALQAAGISVTTKILEKECKTLNPFYLKWITAQRPYVILKAGLSLDGKIATASGESKWITNSAARQYFHALRAEVDAIIVGAGTIQKDHPQLTVRLPERKNVKQPKVIILSKKKISRLPENTMLIDSGRNLKGLLAKLAKQGITSLLVEGGGKVSASFLKAGLVDQVVACIAPKILGGAAKNWFSDLKIAKLANAVQLSDVQFHPAGDNIIVTGNVNVHRHH